MRDYYPKVATTKMVSKRSSSKLGVCKDRENLSTEEAYKSPKYVRVYQSAIANAADLGQDREEEIIVLILPILMPPPTLLYHITGIHYHFISPLKEIRIQ